MTKDMTFEEFTTLVRTYGSDLSRWPSKERGMAAAFSASQHARKILDEEAALDAMLCGISPPEPTPELTARILSIPLSVKQHTHIPQNNPVIWVMLRPMWMKSLVLISCGIAGYAAGRTPANEGYAQFSADQEFKRTISVDSVIMGPQSMNEVIL